MARRSIENEKNTLETSGQPGFDSSAFESLLAGRATKLSTEFISQEEIDALLSTYKLVNAGTPDKGSDRRRTVRMYDFSAPDKFSKDHIRMLNAVHAVFVDSLSVELSELFRLGVVANLVNVEQITYKEYLASIPATTLFAEISAEALSNTILFEVNPSLVGAWIDCLCGGDPKIPAAPSELTSIDLAVAERVIKACGKVYADAWSSIARFTPEITRVVDSEHYDDRLLPSDAVLICTVEISAGRSYGIITICIPAGDVESVLPALSLARTGMASNKRGDKSIARDVERALSPVRMQCRVTLGSTPVTVSDVMGLRVGDIVKTMKRTDEELDAWVGNRLMFGCRPGTLGGNMAVTISRVLDEELLEELVGAEEGEQKQS